MRNEIRIEHCRVVAAGCSAVRAVKRRRLYSQLGSIVWKPVHASKSGAADDGTTEGDSAQCAATASDNQNLRATAAGLHGSNAGVLLGARVPGSGRDLLSLRITPCGVSPPGSCRHLGAAVVPVGHMKEVLV